jgi:hypothetical protein
VANPADVERLRSQLRVGRGTDVDLDGVRQSRTDSLRCLERPPCILGWNQDEMGFQLFQLQQSPLGLP